MSTRVIVLVSDGDGEKYEEVAVFDDTHSAERLLESILEAGYAPESIRVFSGVEMEMRVSHRPVVSLGSDAADGAAHLDDRQAEPDVEISFEPQPVVVTTPSNNGSNETTPRFSFPIPK